MRKLARIVKIDNVTAIDGADAIEASHVGGWAVVTKKGEFVPGALAIYFEIDSFLPEGNPAWQFLVDKSARQFGELKGHVLRTVRLRGQLSQGLILGLDALPAGAQVQEGDDVTELLGVQKYEAPIPANLAGETRGLFPSLVPKTDQERIQNLSAELAQWAQEGLEWEVTEKLEGASCTWAWLDDGLHVCSRNLDLRETADNSLWRVAREHDIEAKLQQLFAGRQLALQGELVGSGVQGNIYRMTRQEFFLFDVYDVVKGEYLRPQERQAVCKALGIKHVPIIGTFKLDASTSMQALLTMADGPSALRKEQAREGLVFKGVSHGASFKAISNKYLLKSQG